MIWEANVQKRGEVVNFLKVINFDYPEWIPAFVSLMPATWLKYKEELERIVLSHPILFPGYREGDFQRMELPRAYKRGRWVDVWGITWDNIEEGLDSAPVEELAPLRNWDKIEEYKVPDPLKYDWYGEEIDWEERRKALERAKAQGYLARGSLVHGAMYMQLYYLRGFTNFMMDIATKDPRLDVLIGMVLDYNLKLIEKWIEVGVEIMYFGDDLGLQKSLPISPTDWRHYLKPCFAQMFGKCRENDVYVYLHTDGYILDIIPDLIECGVNILNPQIRPNTLEGIKKYCKGKVAIHLDLDRQLFPFATKSQLQEHVKQAIDALALPEGGLMLHAECEPDVPLENIETICQTLEDFGCRGMSW